MTLSLAQCHLEGSIGTLRKAAEVHEQRGFLEKAIRLKQAADDLSVLRDPDAVEHVNRRRQRQEPAERPRV